MLTCAGFVEVLVRLENVDGLEEAEALGHARRRAVPLRRRVVTVAEDGAAEEVVLVEEDVVAGRRGLLAGADLLHRPHAPPPLPQSGGAPHAVLDLRCRIAIVITGGVITSNQHSVPPTGQHHLSGIPSFSTYPISGEVGIERTQGHLGISV